MSEIFLSLRFGRWLLARSQNGWRSRRCFLASGHDRCLTHNVTFGRQPTQVFGRPCRRTQRVIALR